MKFSIAAAFTGLIAFAAAVPQYRPANNNYGYPPQSTPARSSPTQNFPSQPTPTLCLTADTAKTLVNGFAGLLTAYTDANADALLDANFTDTSSSINMLAGYPLDSVTFPSKAAFKAGQGSQPAIPFNVISIDSYTCTNVTFRWSTTVVPNGLLVKGINSFVSSNKNNSAAGWQIKNMYR